MKLSEMSVKSSKKMNKLMESRFGFGIDFSKLTVQRAKQLGETIDSNLSNIRRSVDFHTAEKNPRYMELLTVRESLAQWMSENTRQLNEGEVGNAEVLLAAKDIVDSIQDTIEKVGKIQNEQLPQLLDSIRDQIGIDQSEAFKASVGAALSDLMTQLQTAREGVDGGVRVLAGEEVDSPMAMPGDELGDVGVTPPETSDFDMDAGETDGFGATDAAAGGTADVGRELR